VEAYVAGTELYRVTIGIAPLGKARWRRVVARCTGRIGSLVGLLRGELSNDVLAVLTDARDGLFPSRASWRSTARVRTPPSCASTSPRSLYGVAIRLDARPELFFELRQLDQAELIGSATAAVVARPRPVAGKRIAADRLSSVFGIELEEGGAARRARVSRRSAPRPRRGE